MISSQDSKLHEIKKLVFSSSGGLPRLCAEPAQPLSSLVESHMVAHAISTHFNDHEQSLIGGGGAGGQPQQPFDPINVDFSRAEEFLQLEAPIDARKDHNMLKLATDLPRRTFLSRLLRRCVCGLVPVSTSLRPENESDGIPIVYLTVVVVYLLVIYGWP